MYEKNIQIAMDKNGCSYVVLSFVSIELILIQLVRQKTTQLSRFNMYANF